jgi:AcrR family transcriptional regulator
MKEARTNVNGKGWEMAVRIGKTAAKLFNKRGYLETSMNDIAAKAKISKGGVYHYFSSKDEILYFILSNYMDLILTDLEQKLSKIETNVLKIKFIISRHINNKMGHKYYCLYYLYLSHFKYSIPGYPFWFTIWKWGSRT